MFEVQRLLRFPLFSFSACSGNLSARTGATLSAWMHSLHFETVLQRRQGFGRVRFVSVAAVCGQHSEHRHPRQRQPTSQGRGQKTHLFVGAQLLAQRGMQQLPEGPWGPRNAPLRETTGTSCTGDSLGPHNERHHPHLHQTTTQVVNKRGFPLVTPAVCDLTRGGV